MKALAGICYISGFKATGYLVYHKMTGYFLFRKIQRDLDSYDIIHLHSPSFVTKYLKNDSYIITCHADMTPEMVGQNKIFKNSYSEKKFWDMEKKSYARARKIICVDKRLRLFVETITKNKIIFEMKNFIEVDENTKLREKKLTSVEIKILCPRRLVIKNGVRYAIEAMAHMPSGFKLLIAGDGEDEKNLKNLCQELRLKNVVFLGPCSPVQMRDLLSEVDFIVIPSITVNGLQEATSLAALEGFLYGVPVIASDIGGLSEMITHEKTGMLFGEKDITSMAGHFIKLTENPELYENIRQNALVNVIKNYSLSSRIKDIEMIYGEI